MKRDVKRPVSAKALQHKFFRQGGHNLLLLKNMLDALPNVSAYIKDAQGRFMAINRRNLEQCGIPCEDAVIGKRSSDLFPPEMASYIMSRDRQVIETGLPIVARKDIRTGKNPADAITISVYPVKDARGKVIGTACTHYSSNLDITSIPNSRKIWDAITYLRENYTRAIAVKNLPAKFKLSQATFYRTFTSIMKATPGDYLTSLRLCHARELLESTDMTISDIAQSCGFYDHSHFARVFRNERGITPGEYRNRHRTAFTAS